MFLVGFLVVFRKKFISLAEGDRFLGFLRVVDYGA